MAMGILYVVFNESIRNPETNERLYKIGITQNSVSDRYYGLGLKMPGKFETLFAYRLEDYEKAEQFIHGILKKHRENGEWFNLNQKEIDLIKANCEAMGRIDVKDEINNEIMKEKPSIESQNSQTASLDINKGLNMKTKERLDVNDNIPFQITVDALNGLFNKKFKPGFACFGRCFFLTKKKDKAVWFPPLDTLKKGWKNTMPDEMHLYEEKIGAALQPENIDRAIFAKKPGDAYRFVGIFHFEKIIGNIRIYKRVSSELYPEEWDI
jgi:hypothetical protein